MRYQKVCEVELDEEEADVELCNRQHIQLDIGEEDDSEGERDCRICLEAHDQHDLIAPCLCKGSSKWIHRKCLDRWRIMGNRADSFTNCSECKFKYEIISVEEGEEELNHEYTPVALCCLQAIFRVVFCNSSSKITIRKLRRLKYRFLIWRDIFILFVIKFVFIGLFGLLARFLDETFMMCLNKIQPSELHVDETNCTAGPVFFSFMHSKPTYDIEYDEKHQVVSWHIHPSHHSSADYFFTYLFGGLILFCFFVGLVGIYCSCKYGAGATSEPALIDNCFIWWFIGSSSSATLSYFTHQIGDEHSSMVGEDYGDGGVASNDMTRGDGNHEDDYRESYENQLFQREGEEDEEGNGCCCCCDGNGDGCNCCSECTYFGGIHGCDGCYCFGAGGDCACGDCACVDGMACGDMGEAAIFIIPIIVVIVSIFGLIYGLKVFGTITAKIMKRHSRIIKRQLVAPTQIVVDLAGKDIRSKGLNVV